MVARTGNACCLAAVLRDSAAGRIRRVATKNSLAGTADKPLSDKRLHYVDEGLGAAHWLPLSLGLRWAFAIRTKVKPLDPTAPRPHCIN